jgi:hypothetical protein
MNSILGVRSTRIGDSTQILARIAAFSMAIMAIVELSQVDVERVLRELVQWQPMEGEEGGSTDV